jgi:hypothetical protein
VALASAWFFLGTVVLASGKFVVQFPNQLGKKLDDGHSERLLKCSDMFVRHLGPTGLDVGQHFTGNVISLALQTRRQNLL